MKHPINETAADNIAFQHILLNFSNALEDENSDAHEELEKLHIFLASRSPLEIAAFTAIAILSIIDSGGKDDAQLIAKNLGIGVRESAESRKELVARIIKEHHENCRRCNKHE